MATMSVSPPSAGVPTPPPSLAQAVLEMLSRADRAIEADPRSARLFIGQAAYLLAPASDAPSRSALLGLTPRQEREIVRHIDNNLDRTIRNDELAKIAGLSVGRFSRRFKDSFGLSPRGYVIRSRLERAKTLMMETRRSLSQIALDSGFADQAHMCRQFHAIIGDTPTRWKRIQMLDQPA